MTSEKEIYFQPSNTSMDRNGNLSIELNKQTAINFQDYSKRRSTVAPEHVMSDMSNRLRKRKFLHGRLSIVSDIMCILAALGIILMVVENELNFHKFHDQDSRASWGIKVVISTSTAILLGCILYYNYLDLKLYANQNSIDDFRVGLTPFKIFLVIVELIVCAVHPMPRAFPPTVLKDSDDTVIVPYPLTYAPVDAALGLPMFLRLYMFGRSMLFHSSLVRDTSLRSLGYLNQVPMNFFFLMKTGLEKWPGRCLLATCTLVFFIGSWSIRACDFLTDGHHLSMSDSMWLFTVTFATVGYGDIIPSTYCARTVATIISLIGLLASAFLIAVLTQKLQFSREERYVYTFGLNIDLAKQLKDEAANVVKFSIKFWYIKQKGKALLYSRIRAQQKLFESINNLKQVKKDRKGLIGRCVDLQEIMTVQKSTSEQGESVTEQINEIKQEMKSEMKKFEDKLDLLTRNMDTIQNSLSTLVDSLNGYSAL